MKVFRTLRQKAFKKMMRGPKRGQNPAATVDPAILVIKKGEEDKAIRPITEYPGWLSGLAQPQLKLKHRVVMLHLEDTDAFLPTVDDLRTMISQTSRKRYKEATRRWSEKQGDLFSEEDWGVENSTLPEWYTEEAALSRILAEEFRKKTAGIEDTDQQFETDVQKAFEQYKREFT